MTQTYHTKLVALDVVLSVCLPNCITYLCRLKISTTFLITLEWKAVVGFYIKQKRN